MSITLQQFILPRDIHVDKGTSIFSQSDHQICTLNANFTHNVRAKFSIPRSTQRAIGSKITAVTFIYKLETGTLSYMTPTLSKYTYTDNVLEGVSSVQITTPDVSFPSEDFVLVPSTNVNKVRSKVDEPLWDNSPGNVSLCWLYNITIAADTSSRLHIYGMEIEYVLCIQNNITYATTYQSSFTADINTSGMVINVDTTSAAVTVTLPVISVSCITLTFRLVGGTNALRISPNAINSIQGLNINNDAIVNRDYILAAGLSNDYITIISTTGSWRVVSALGTWTRE